MGYLSDQIKLTKVADHTTAATTAVNSAAIDMSDYNGVLFITSFGTAATGNTINAAESTASGGTYVDLAGTSVTSGASDEDVWLDVYKPDKEFIRLEAVRSGASSTLESIWAIQYEPRTTPVDNTTTGTIAGEAHTSPATGTA